MFDIQTNAALASNMWILTIFGVISAIVFYIWSGFKITAKMDDVYGYNIWNFATVIPMMYAPLTWVVFVLFSPSSISPDQAIIMKLTSLVCFLFVFIWNTKHSSFGWAIIITFYQASLSFVIFWLALLGGLCGGSSKKD